MNNEPILVKPSELPKTFELKSTPGIYYFFMVLGFSILAVGVLSLIFAPSTLYYRGSMTFFQVVYMHPGPVISIGVLIVSAASHAVSSRVNNKAKEILESHELDPNANVPERACLSIEQGKNTLLLVMAIEEVEEEAELAS